MRGGEEGIQRSTPAVKEKLFLRVTNYKTVAERQTHSLCNGMRFCTARSTPFAPSASWHLKRRVLKSSAGSTLSYKCNPLFLFDITTFTRDCCRIEYWRLASITRFKSQSARFHRARFRHCGGRKAWLSAAIHGWRFAARLRVCHCSSDRP